MWLGWPGASEALRMTWQKLNGEDDVAAVERGGGLASRTGDDDVAGLILRMTWQEFYREDDVAGAEQR